MNFLKIVKNKKIKQEINFFVWFLFTFVFLLGVTGLILGIVGTVKYKPDIFVTTSRLSDAITSLVLAAFSFLLLTYVVAEYVLDKNPFRIEVSIRLFLLLICIFAGLLSVLFGALALTV